MWSDIEMRFNRARMKIIMKLTKTVFVWAAILAATAASGVEQPLVRLSVRSFSGFTNAVGQVVRNVAPDEKTDPGLELSKGLGMTNLTGLDIERPWEIALWYGGGGESPLVAIKAPVKDVAKFKENLSPDGPLGAKAVEWIQLSNDVGLVVLRETGSLSEWEKSALEKWKAEAVTKPAPLVELKLSMNDSIRDQAIAALGFAKGAMGAAMAAQNSGTAGLPNQAAILGILSAYFDAIDMFVAGLQNLNLRLDLSSDFLTVEELVTTKPGSDLAKELQAPKGEVTAQDMSLVGPDHVFSGAAYISAGPWLQKLMPKLIALGLQAQNSETNGPAVKELEDLSRKMLPVAVAGWADIKDKVAFAVSYRFPEGNAAEIYAQLKRFMTNGFQTFVGKDKMYSAVSLTEKDHTIDGVAVDRLSFTVNTDSPLFKAPGQKEALQMFWPNGKMEFDYAVKGDRLLVANAGGMKELLAPDAGKSNWKTALKPDKGTCLVGYVDLLGLISRVAAANPGIPEAVKDKMAKLNGQGTAVEFQLSVDNEIRYSARVPLKLFHELGQLKGD
jgi:hypothetical protein